MFSISDITVVEFRGALAFLFEFTSWQNLAAITNSAFMTSLIGALAGAYAGAFGAQRISERSKERAEFQAQIRNSNTAITLSFMVCNSMIALKQQQTKVLCDTYFAKRAELAGFLEMRAGGEIPPEAPFDFTAELGSVPFPTVPIDALRSLVYEKLSVSRRPIALVAALTGALSSLAETIENRNGQISKFKNLTPENRQLLALYFGLPYAGGHVSTEYPDAMEGLKNLTDDVIFFSHLLCKDLEAHGNEVLYKLRSRFKGVVDQIHPIELSPDRTAGLIPTLEQYSEWISGFSQTK